MVDLSVGTGPGVTSVTTAGTPWTSSLHCGTAGGRYSGRPKLQLSKMG